MPAGLLMMRNCGVSVITAIGISGSGVMAGFRRMNVLGSITSGVVSERIVCGFLGE